MFTRFTTDFAEVSASQAVRGAMFSLSAETMVESQRGWKAVKDLRPSDTLASLDGGFVPLAWVRRALPSSTLHVPGGSLGNCDDLSLPSDTRIGLTAPLDFEPATTDTLSVPLSAFEGVRGIRKQTQHDQQSFTIGLASEEMIWAQTGLLIHAKPMTSPYFHALSFSQTRALLAIAPSDFPALRVAA